MIVCRQCLQAIESHEGHQIQRKLSPLDDGEFIKDGYGDFKVCISKTPLSLSDDPKKLNVPSFSLHINSLRLFFGAKFVVPMSGNVIAMPGLNKNPRGKNM